MNIPFTMGEFLGVFKQYNLAVWPMQVVLNLLAIVALMFAFTPARYTNKTIAGILSLFWLWMGIVYHILFFTSINPAAYLFGALFVLQGGLFVLSGALKQRLSFHYRNDARGIAGAVLIAYALLAYPLLGHALGHVYPASPTFGLPCPTTIFTLGLLLWTDTRVPRYMLVIPFIWSLIGFSAALTLGILEDTGLLVAGLVSAVMLLKNDRGKAT